jgi:hypothetical protein
MGAGASIVSQNNICSSNIKADIRLQVFPRVVQKSEYFFIQLCDKTINSEIRYLSCSGSGQISLSKESSLNEIWLLSYISASWPQHYFRLYNKTNKRYLQAHLTNELETGELFGRLDSLPKSELDRSSFDRKTLFYLSKDDDDDDDCLTYHINTTFGLQFVNETDQVVSLMSNPKKENISSWNLKRTPNHKS